MTRTRFHQGLDDLKQKLLTMGGMAEHSVERAVRATSIAVCHPSSTLPVIEFSSSAGGISSTIGPESLAL